MICGGVGRAAAWLACMSLPLSGQIAPAMEPVPGVQAASPPVAGTPQQAGSAAVTAPEIDGTASTVPNGAAEQRVVLPSKPSVVVSAGHRAKAEQLYLRGAKQIEDRRFAEAEKSFAEAVTLDPTRLEILQALALAQEHRITSLLQMSAQERDRNPAEADRLMAQARGIDPENPRVVQHDGAGAGQVAGQVAGQARFALPSQRQPVALAGPLQLEPNGEKHGFHLKGDTGAIAVAVATAYGLRAVLDTELQPKQNLRMDVDDTMDYRQAMETMGMLTGTFATPLDAHTVLIANDSAANRMRLEHLVDEVIPLPGYTSEQITDAANMVKSVFDQSRVSFEAQIGAIAVRAPEDTLETINRTLADLLDTGSEVVVDVKVYSVNSEKTRNLGVSLPVSLGAFNVNSEATNVVAANQSLVNQLIANGVIPAGTSTTVIAAYLVFVAGLSTTSVLKNTFLLFGGGLTQTGLTAGSFPVLNLLLQQTDARELDDVQLRVGDRTKSTVKSGTRYPIQTSLFSDIATSTTSSLAGVSVNGVSLSSLLSQYLGTSSLGSGAVVPQIQYEDLGLVLTAEPHVQREGTIQMHLDVKITALAGAALNGIPILQSRQFSSDLTVGDGETALMSSNVTESELRAASGIPGLNELPGFQGGTNRLTDVTKGNLVVLITPHIVRHAHPAAKGPYIPVANRPETE